MSPSGETERSVTDGEVDGVELFEVVGERPAALGDRVGVELAEDAEGGDDLD